MKEVLEELSARVGSQQQPYFLIKLVTLFSGDESDIIAAVGHCYRGIAALRLLFCPD